jgi:hypothetical protein
VCTVKKSWWWTEELSETCRGWFLIYIWEISISSCFSYKNLSRCTVWHIPLLCVHKKTPDDGKRNCPKHVKFYSKNIFEKLVHLVGFSIRIYHVARSGIYHCRLYSEKTPDDWQRNCPKHVEFYSKSIFEKFVHLVGFTIRIYNDGRSAER